MIAQLRAVKAELPEAWPIHVLVVKGATQTTVPAVPYVVLESPGFGLPEEVPASDATEDLATSLRVKVVATSGTECAAILDIVRGVLSPGGALTRIPLEGHRLETKYLRSEFIAADTSLKVLSTNTHPVVGVESYDLTSQPLT